MTLPLSGNLLDEYFELSTNLNFLSRFSLAEPAAPLAKINSIDITLKNINLQAPTSNNREAYARGLDIFSRTADAKKSPITLAKIKADAIELIKLDKKLIEQVETILKNIGFTPEQIDKEIGHLKKEKPKAVPQLAQTVKISIKMFPHIKNQLDILKAMDTKTPEKKEEQRDKANEYINVLEDYVLKNKALVRNDKSKINEIEKTAQAILSITPLTISTVIKTLRNAGFEQSYIYTLITETYKKQIKFIKSELGLGSRNIAQKGELPNRGPCDDISDALTYGIAIASEIMQLKTKRDVEGGLNKIEEDFLKQITALQSELDSFLKTSDNIKKAFAHCTHLTVDAYSEMIETRRPIFCRRNELEFQKLQSQECTSYVSFYSLLESIGKLIAEYTNKKKPTKLQKINIQQKIVNQLNNFIYYNTPSDKVEICQRCLERDIFRWVTGKQHDEDFYGTYGEMPMRPAAHRNYETELNNEFKKITDFFNELPASEKNSATESGISAAQLIREMLKKSFDIEQKRGAID